MKEKKLIKKIQQLATGAFEGGFVVLESRAAIVGGVEDPVNNCQGGTCQTNNCNGGNCKNCVLGCGQT